jgi:hypothetical protein
MHKNVHKTQGKKKQKGMNKCHRAILESILNGVQMDTQIRTKKNAVLGIKKRHRSQLLACTEGQSVRFTDQNRGGTALKTPPK